MKKHLLSFVLLSFALLNLNCKKSPTEIDKPPLLPTFELSLDDVTCTEVWIKVKKQNDTSFLPISLTVNDKEFFRGFLKGVDTIFFVENLKASTSYSVKGTIQTGQQETKEIKVTTLPTTSHNFTWQTFTFGGNARSSALVDVAIIDENNIWAVGEIYMKDSLGNPDPHAYNAVHWDGSKWEVKKISVLFRGSYITPSLEGICAFSTNDIWFVGSLPIHGDGNNWTMYDLRTTLNPNLSLSKAWGVNSTNIYFVGRAGSVVYYDGVNWQKIESRTTTSLDDVWGTDDGKTIWACGRDPNNLKSVFVKYENGACTTLWQRDGMVSVPPYGNGVYSVWMNNQTLYKSTSKGIYMERGTTNVVMPNNKLRYFRVIRGNGGNDLLTIDDQSVWHYNGESWEALTNDDPNLILFGGSINGNTAVVVGSDFSIGLGAAMIQIGRR